MKSVFCMMMSSLLALSAIAQEKLTLRDLIDGTFAAKYVGGINPIAGTDEFAKISDEGALVEKFSFKTGKCTGVLFDGSASYSGISFDKVDDYLLSPDGKSLLIQTNTKRIYRRSFTADFYVWNIQKKQLTPLSVNGAQQIPTFSPDGKHIAFVRQNNIFITDGTVTGEVQVTSDGKLNEVINGIPDWVNEEEFGISNAMAWSADGSTLCWIRYDESHVKTYDIQLFNAGKLDNEEYSLYPSSYSYKYPKAGETNSVVTVWSYELATGQTRQLQVPLNDDGYIPRIKTMPGCKEVVVCTMNRHQDTLKIFAAHPQTTVCRLLMEESVPKYVKEEVVKNLQVTDRHILLPSDRDGYMHVYLYDMNGKQLRQVDRGDYDVTELCGYDEKSGTTYLQAAWPLPTQRTVFAVDANGNRKVVGREKGWDSVIFSDDFRYCVNIWSNAKTPYLVEVFDRQGRRLRTITDNKELKEKLAAFQLPEKDFFKFTTSEGIELYGWMIKPTDFDATKKYPVVMFQYGGPSNQQVRDSWSIGSMGQGGLFDAYLAQKGCLVVCVDGRGTGGRGAEFEKCTYLRIGDLESKDQVETALWLGSLPYVDEGRIGIWGWSFGGFNTLMSMSEGRPAFKAGVAVAPPTNWRFYDSIYTERYMRTPQENPDGYNINPIQRAGQLHGDLLICHGLADDNVHPQNTFEYSEALVRADKDFKEIIYTNKNHSINGGNTRNHLLRQIVNFLERELNF